MDKKNLINIAGITITLLAFAFLLKTFLSFDVNYSALLSSKYAFFILIATGFSALSVFFAACCWQKLMFYFSGKKINFKIVFNFYAKATLGKYLPGNVGHYLSRQVFGASLGLKQTHLAIVSILEILYNAGAAFILSAILMRNKIFELVAKISTVLDISMFVTTVLFICFSSLVFLFFVFRKNRYFIELISLAKNSGFWLLLLELFLFASVCLLILGLMLALVIGISVPVGVDNIMVIITSSIISWLIGFVTPGSPGGIGVRETVLVFMLSPLFSKEVILISVVLQRIAMVCGDVLAWIVSIAIQKE
ncbi:hypothetical protein AGMMS50276_09530 [Synergistales bacterium]|nr:hypothetical protein AGMMS50276_09530 [Synergistales bacterium]